MNIPTIALLVLIYHEFQCMLFERNTSLIFFKSTSNNTLIFVCPTKTKLYSQLASYLTDCIAWLADWLAG